MKQYLLAVYSAESGPEVPSEEQMQQAYESVAAFNSEVRTAGAWVFASGLHPSAYEAAIAAANGAERSFLQQRRDSL